MAEERIRIAVPDADEVSAIRTTPEGRPAGWRFIYAPGAGSNVHDPFGTHASRELAARGLDCVRFQFPSMEAGRRGPDRPPVLEATWRAVIDALRPAGARLVVGGRSMGGRIASQVLAQSVRADALALFAYPLHAPSTPAQWRDEPFPSIDAPVFFCSGTRDAFATPDELHAAASKVRRAALHLLEGADHGFAAPKSSGRTRQDVWTEAAGALLGWLEHLT